MPDKDAKAHEAAGEQDIAASTPPAEKEPSAADLAAELAATQDRLLRALAEQENSRRRARRERDEAVRYAASDFAADLLSSIDDLERAVASCGVSTGCPRLGGVWSWVDYPRCRHEVYASYSGG